MSGRFDELVGAEISGEERERLRRAHELLVAAGTPAELPPSLAAPPAVGGRRAAGSRWLPLALPAAAALALAFFAGAYVGGRDGGEPFRTDFVLAMSGTTSAPHAAGSLRVGEIDQAGNWPMELTVRGLPAGRRYELLLTRDGEPVASCGYFVTAEGTTAALLNAPYRLRDFDGWVVVREGSDRVLLRDADA